ncbi:MAG: glycerophosphodiester phosphodiesterase family protein [Bacteroidota bacterium]
MKKLTLLLLISILFSCKKEKFDVQNLNGESLAIGHGGMGIGYSYPMNSYESIRYALEIGADGVEIDVDMTSDGVLVAYHDGDLSEATNGSGAIYEKKWSDINQLRFKSVPYSDYKIRSLDEILSKLPELGSHKFFLDCKLFSPNESDEYAEQFNRKLLELIDKYGIAGNCFVEHKRENLIIDLTRRRQDIKVIVYEEFNKAVTLAEKYKLYGVILPIEELNTERMSLLHGKNLRVTTFNLLSKEHNKEALRLNVEYLQTDKVKHLIDLL